MKIYDFVLRAHGWAFYMPGAFMFNGAPYRQAYLVEVKGMRGVCGVVEFRGRFMEIKGDDGEK